MNDSRFRFKRPESVLVLVHTPDLEVLLIKRTRPVFWQSVTGGLKWPDEAPVSGAARELAEETGIVVTDISLKDWHCTESFEIPAAWTDKYGPDGATNTEHLFSVEVPKRIDIQLNSHEHTDFRWVGIDQAIDDVWSWTNRNGLIALRDAHGALQGGE